MTDIEMNFSANGNSTQNNKIEVNFEKDIDVPSKRRIMDDYNAIDCEQCTPDSVCCYCKNIACYKLEQQLQQANQKLEKIKSYIAQEDWCVLDHVSEGVLKIIEGENNDR